MDVGEAAAGRGPGNRAPRGGDLTIISLVHPSTASPFPTSAAFRRDRTPPAIQAALGATRLERGPAKAGLRSRKMGDAMLTDLHWQTLVAKIRAEACTPFIGAGACAGVLPMAGDLAKKLLEGEMAGRSAAAAAPAGEGNAGGPRTVTEPGSTAAMASGQNGAPASVAPPVPVKDQKNLSQVTQYLAVQHQDNSWPKLQIAGLWRQAARPDFTRPSEPHALLAGLGLPIYLTTNYDDFMVSALKARDTTPTREICRWNQQVADRSSVFDAGYQPSPRQPLVFHLHGHTDDPDSMVVTEDDYLDFVVAISKDLASAPTVAGQRAVLPLRIRRAITSTTLLFVGYSLSDINFRVILRGLVGSLEPSSRRLSIAVQLPPEDSDSLGRLEKYLDDYFDWTMNVRVFWGTADQFARQLREHLD